MKFNLATVNTFGNVGKLRITKLEAACFGLPLRLAAT
jgi:hypothetical protein